MSRPLLSLLLVGAGMATLLGATRAAAAGLEVSTRLLAAFVSSGAVPTTRCTAAAEADTHVDQGSPDTNFGTESLASVRSEADKNKRALVRFDLSACSIPQDASVQSAVLRLHLSNAPDSDRAYDAYRVTGSWTEAGATWNIQPTTAAAATGSVATGTTDGVWIEWTVTTDVAAFVDGSAANEGWLVRDQEEGALILGQQGDFSSREHADSAQHPALVVDYYP